MELFKFLNEETERAAVFAVHGWGVRGREHDKTLWSISAQRGFVIELVDGLGDDGAHV